jgi:hypothetical protein
MFNRVILTDEIRHGPRNQSKLSNSKLFRSKYWMKPRMTSSITVGVLWIYETYLTAVCQWTMWDCRSHELHLMWWLRLLNLVYDPYFPRNFQLGTYNLFCHFALYMVCDTDVICRHNKLANIAKLTRIFFNIHKYLPSSDLPLVRKTIAESEY